jgi:hypothetical protein
MKRLMFITAAVLLALGTQSFAGPADEGWIVLSDSLSHFQEPLGDWYTADSVRVNAENDRQLQGELGTGILVNGKTGRTHNLTTRDKWGDLEVQLEFMIPRRSNSGVKLHGVYEIQIYDSAGKTGKLTGADCGGIYPRGEMKPRYHHLDDGIAPRVNAAEKPGEWQSVQIVFRAPRFNAKNEKITNAQFERVLLNGQVIHDHVELLHPTGNAWKDKEHPTGPLLIQADHGPVAVRNVRVRPLDK